MKNIYIAAIIIAYIVGFSAGCLVLNAIKLPAEGGTAPGTTAQKHGHASGAVSAHKPGRLPQKHPAAPPVPELVRFTDTSSPGQEVQILLRTAPGMVCTIRYLNPSGIDETLPVSIFQITGADGLCGWKFPLPGDSKPGNATLIISAGGVTEEYFFKVTP